MIQTPVNLVRALTRVGLLASALALAAFYFALFLRDNAAPAVDLTGFRTADADEFQYEMDSCQSNDKKLAVSGWVVRIGHGADVHNVRVVIVDRRSGRAYALKTSLQQSNALRDRLKQRLGDRIVYRNAGFTASLRRETADRPIRHGQLYLAYSDAELSVLLPLPCRVEGSR